MILKKSESSAAGESIHFIKNEHLYCRQLPLNEFV